MSTFVHREARADRGGVAPLDGVRSLLALAHPTPAKKEVAS
jgi:hypothetical protein